MENKINKGADFSFDMKYRYKLWRIWDDRLPLAMCIGLNPSNANADKNDPTINNLVSILTTLGYGGFYMTNLFAWISSKPQDLLTCDDPVGYNDINLKEVAQVCNDVIFCWGSFKQAEERVKDVIPRYPNAKCFGKTKNGSPWHPLALMYNGTVKTPKLIPFFDPQDTQPVENRL